MIRDPNICDCSIRVFIIFIIHLCVLLESIDLVTTQYTNNNVSAHYAFYYVGIFDVYPCRIYVAVSPHASAVHISGKPVVPIIEL